MKIGLKGIIDLQTTEKKENKQIIIDYKTSNSISESKNFERQALFYNLLVHKKKNIIPAKTCFHYLKLGISKDYVFSQSQIEEFHQELNDIAEEILSLGDDINNYPAGEIENVFNSKKQACLREIERRKRDLRNY
jgi:CRISPR/Cas system-associated exonuclease Cas4 (RecB family)